jgi:hypothetical protein
MMGVGHETARGQTRHLKGGSCSRSPVAVFFSFKQCAWQFSGAKDAPRTLRSCQGIQSPLCALRPFHLSPLQKHSVPQALNGGDE